MDRAGDEAAGLQRVDPPQRVRRLAARVAQVEELAADHAGHAGRAADLAQDADLRLGRPGWRSATSCTPRRRGRRRRGWPRPRRRARGRSAGRGAGRRRPSPAGRRGSASRCAPARCAAAVGSRSSGRWPRLSAVASASTGRMRLPPASSEWRIASISPSVPAISRSSSGSVAENVEVLEVLLDHVAQVLGVGRRGLRDGRTRQDTAGRAASGVASRRESADPARRRRPAPRGRARPGRRARRDRRRGARRPHLRDRRQDDGARAPIRRSARCPRRSATRWPGWSPRWGRGCRGLRAGDAVVVANSAPCGVCPACRAGRPNLCRRITYLTGAFAERLRVPAPIVARNVCTAARRGSRPRWPRSAEPLACAVHTARGCAAGRPARGARARRRRAGPVPGRPARRAPASRVTLVDPHADRRAARAALRRGGRPRGARATRTPRRARAGCAGGARRRPRRRGRRARRRRGGWPSRSRARAARWCCHGGCPAGSHVDAADRAAFTIQSSRCAASYHHTPDAFREALAVLADGTSLVRDMLHEPIGLADVPDVLRTSRGVKHPVMPDS